MATENRVAIKARRLVDVRAGSYVDLPVVVVLGNRIEAIRTSVPTGCEVLDLGERTLLPGLIDAHTHVLLHMNKLGPRTEQDTLPYQMLEEYPAHRVARSIRALRISLEHGFTSIRDVGTEGAGYDDVGLRDAIAEGVIPGPRMQVAGPALSPTGTYPIVHYRPDWQFPRGVGACDGPVGCRRAVREQASYGVDWIKVYATAGYGTSFTDDGYIDSPPNWTREELFSLVDEAHMRGLKVAAHATTITGTQMAIEAGVESIEHAHTIRPDMAEQIAARGIFVVPTLTTSIREASGFGRPVSPLWERIPEVQRVSLDNCRAAGVKIVLGTDAGSPGIGWTNVNQAEELRQHVALGLSPLESIQSATIVAAELLGSAEVGEIRAGARADLVGALADPLADVSVLEHIDFVMKDGKTVRWRS